MPITATSNPKTRIHAGPARPFVNTHTPDHPLPFARQSLQLSVQMQNYDFVNAMKQDSNEFIAMLQTIITKHSTVDIQMVETMADIDQYLKGKMHFIPEVNKEGFRNFLIGIQDDLARRMGRTLVAPSDYSVSSDEVEIYYDQVIGNDSLGHVYKGMWNRKDVAIKTISKTKPREAISIIEREAAIWLKVHSANVLTFYGACLNTDEPFLIMPRLQADLPSYLMLHPKTDLQTRIQFIVGIANAMKNLHELEEPLIHGDLKT
eukprot:jgi/Hompol1/3322/HPOL_006469-RA